ncbi:DoxX family membrane protein [Streptacidiphilus rugosus]|uniref:DoxX family membrane protein n=1 Tax=Streptacidiphilus rugosus TaxID=405783 RepID=UPI000689224D|nr:DoxX family membrane protein [Streptacidiphilus rugosus]
MSTHSHASHGFRLPALARKQRADEAAGTTTLFAADYALAALRVLVGFVFLWAFLDKTFGLGYATPSAKAWIHGGSPAKGFLGSVAVGPLQSTFHSWAGQGWADWLFMLGLLGIGLAVISGVALRLSAAAGSVLLALMWLAEFPPARHLASGAPSMSTNPFADYHVVYAAALIAVAAVATGSRLGLGRLWSSLPVVRDHAWLR